MLLIVGLVSGAAGWFSQQLLRPDHTGQAPLPTTIEQVRARPEDFAGKRVELSGKLDECFQWECSICPEAMTDQRRDPRKCLAIEFQPLVTGTGFGEEQQEDVFRFSSVELSADFDPTCWTAAACTDRATVLSNAVISKVMKRRSSGLGLWMSPDAPLHEIAGPLAESVKSSALSAGFPPSEPIKAFATDADPPAIVVCSSVPAFGAAEVGIWPRSLAAALFAPSTSDLYHCKGVRKVGGSLVVQAI